MRLPRLLLLVTLYSIPATAMNMLTRPSSTLSSFYEPPTCGARQSCLFAMDDLRFEMCACPSGSKCGDHTAVHQGIDYKFCGNPNLPVCESGAHSVTVEGLQTTLHCVCESPMIERKIQSGMLKSEFLCTTPPMSAKMVKLIRGWKRRSSRILKQRAINPSSTYSEEVIEIAESADAE